MVWTLVSWDIELQSCVGHSGIPKVETWTEAKTLLSEWKTTHPNVIWILVGESNNEWINSCKY